MSDIITWFTDGEHWTGSSGIPARLVEHLAICAWAMGIALLIAIPLGIWLGHVNRFGLLVTSIGNLGRAIPTFALLILLASWDVIGVSDLAAILALAVFAIPPILTNAFIGVRDVDRDVTESARGMGMKPGQVLRIVELPLAVPVLAAGTVSYTHLTLPTKRIV